MMYIRQAREQDLERLLEIYQQARVYMEQEGNPNQWGKTWPPTSLIQQDIEEQKSYVCVNEEGVVIGTFFFDQGEEIDPTYREIFEGQWLAGGSYGVIHRLAGDGSEKGIGRFCIQWALEQCGHLRIDTHEDNKIMQKILKDLGFVHCGTIYVADHSPRLAYEKMIG